ncbi:MULTISPECIES: TetR/AcrR family transcriptional regulator [unclassified Nocardia]|uniref:TetR/AcrR family transcriptional regulator n=1 Tax=unclassified Nocardia TaxID=2637762 RepID=UPI001CE42C99|nr:MULTISPECIES: TetR/AcrR family transcriptional regulator [unclassified Nocardia]
MSTHRGPGRPVDLAKRDAILAAARVEFLDKGFERATMDAVAAGAGVSKRTVFGHFGDKVSLLEAIVDAEAGRLEHAVLGADDLPDPVAQLTRCGEALIALLVSPDILAFDRIFAFEPYRGSDLVRRFFAAGPQRGRTMVIRLVGRTAELGIIRTDDVERAADDLLALWLGGTWREEIALGLCQSPSEQEIRDRVRHGLTGFLRMYDPH